MRGPLAPLSWRITITANLVALALPSGTSFKFRPGIHYLIMDYKRQRREEGKKLTTDKTSFVYNLLKAIRELQNGQIRLFEEISELKEILLKGEEDASQGCISEVNSEEGDSEECGSED